MSAPALADGFSAGNVVVLRKGSGSGTQTNAAVPVTLLEYDAATGNSTGTTVALPSSGVTNNSGNLVLSGSATSDGGLSLSSNGQYLTLAGYDAVAGSASVSGTTSAVANRIIGRVDVSSLAVDVSTRLTDNSFSGDNVRGVVSDDGTHFWASGNASSNTNRGVRYVSSLGGSTSAQVFSASTRQVAIIAGNLVYDTSTAVAGLGNPPPTTLTTSTAIATVANGGQFVMLDRSPSASATGFGTMDTLYVADGSAGIDKFEWTGSAWTARGAVATAASDVLFGLTGVVTDATATFYTTNAVSAAGNNSLFKFVDTSAFGANLAGSYSSVATAGDGYNFAGAQIVMPVPEPASMAMFGLFGCLALRRRRNLKT